MSLGLTFSHRFKKKLVSWELWNCFTSSLPPWEKFMSCSFRAGYRDSDKLLSEWKPCFRSGCLAVAFGLLVLPLPPWMSWDVRDQDPSILSMPCWNRTSVQHNLVSICQIQIHVCLDVQVILGYSVYYNQGCNFSVTLPTWHKQDNVMVI